MKVILVEDVEKIGAAGDIVGVKAGFARNFLLPGKKAIECTKANMLVLESIKRKKAQGLEREKQELVVLAEKINAHSCTIPVTVGEEDKLFGSVSHAVFAAGIILPLLMIACGEGPRPASERPPAAPRWPLSRRPASPPRPSWPTPTLRGTHPPPSTSA